MRLPPTRGLTSPQRVVALDPSLNNFGVVVLEGGEVVESLVIQSGKLTGMARIENILVKLAPHAQKGVLVREDYAYAASSGADAVLKELGGVLDYFFHLRNRRLYRVGVAQVKKFVTGAGNAKKDQMMLAVYKDFGFDPPNADIADAFGVAAFASDLLKYPRPGKTKAHHVEVVKKAREAGHPLTTFAQNSSE